MKKRYLLVILTCLLLLSAFPALGQEARAASYMSNKTEIPVDLEVSGAEAICQTENGYVWIAQYSGLTRYDSKEFVTYKSFEYNEQEYSVINVRALAAEGDTLYIGTSEHIYVYKDYHFEPLLMDPGVVTGIVLDEGKDLLYISTQDNGGIIYDIAKGTKTTIPGSEGKYVRDIALDLERDNCYYQVGEGVYDKNGNEVFLNSRLLEIYSYGTTLFMAEDSGIVHRYDMKNGKMLDDFTIPDQVNRMLYSEEDQLLFVACEKDGIYCVDFSTSEPTVALAGDLESKSQLVDLMIDYEGNLTISALPASPSSRGTRCPSCSMTIRSGSP